MNTHVHKRSVAKIKTLTIIVFIMVLIISIYFKPYDFYEKLLDEADVNILIVGDSIGNGYGSSDKSNNWISLLSKDLSDKYGVKCNITNISMGGNSSYAGYVRTMELKDNIDYDLAIICYGQNDEDNDFSLYYESVIRAIQKKYKKCEIISVLESSQRKYTTKIQEIQKLCSYYNIPTADTISAFNNSGVAYENLTKDGIHPSNEGHKLYSETIKNVIIAKLKNNVRMYRRISPYNKDVVKFNTFKQIQVAEFKKVNGTTFEIKTKNISGIMGIDYSFESGDNVANIYIDDQLFAAPKVSFNYDFSQRHIIIVGNDCKVNDIIRINFGSTDQANGFKRVIFSNVNN